MALDSAMLASSLRRLPTNDNDAAVLAGALRSAEMPAVVRDLTFNPNRDP